MAATSTQPPDPQTLGSWEDAFQYPLPVVRKLEQQLRRNMDDNRQKLRSLVGTSYRDLLGTAERIIEMDTQIQIAEKTMSEMGRKCNAGMVERVGSNYVRIQKAKHGKEKETEERCRRVAQIKVLQSCVTVTGRIVRAGGDALVAAKVLVLARLLHKSLSETADTTRVLEELRKKLGSARKRLLGYISRLLVSADVEKTRTVKTLCAYSLISSASPKEVLRHFLQVRFEQLEAKAEKSEEQSLLEMLDLYSQTLLDTRELFPRRFADALGQLSHVTLVRDPDVRAVHGLSLDVYEQWISDDVRNFHPWVRHDQLASAEVGDTLASWTKQAQKCSLQGLRDALDEQTDAQSVVELREKVLSKYISLSAKVSSDAHAQAINDIRSSFLSRLEDLAAQAAKIANFSVVDEKPFDSTAVSSLWDLATAEVDLNGGAVKFRKAIINGQHGHGSSIAMATAALDMWIDRLQGFNQIIASMRATKWDNDLDFELDDPTDGDPLQVVLTRRDPQRLETRLQQETTKALQATYQTIEKGLEPFGSPRTLQRIVREVDRRRRGLENQFEQLGSVKAEPTFIAASHERTAASISEGPLQQFSRSIEGRSYTPVALWDGTPRLPVQPTPGTFRFLRTLHRHMSEAGNDLWSPDAVQVLKRHIAEHIAALLNVTKIDAAVTESSLTNGHAADADKAADGTANGEGEGEVRNASREQLIQVLFDVLYLQRIFSNGSKGGQLAAVLQEIGQRAQMDATGLERLGKSANEYWKRTYLLFGLLAVEQTS